jgi:diacylglycerol kinase family enzyme
MVLNPISGGRNKESFIAWAQALLETYAWRHEIFHTTGENDLQKLKEAIAQYNPDRIAVLGGDGTVLLVAQAVKGKDIPMGIIPFGSANGMAAEMNLEADPKKCWHHFMMSHKLLELDIIIFNNEYPCIHIGDVGLNAHVIQGFENDPNRGMTTYAKHFINVVRKAEKMEMTLVADGASYEESGYMLAFCNARKYGTGVPLNLKGNPFDGKFELVLVRDINMKEILRAGATKFEESFYNHSNTWQLSVDSAHIRFKTPQLLQLDGELIGEFEELTIRVDKARALLLGGPQSPN